MNERDFCCPVTASSSVADWGALVKYVISHHPPADSEVLRDVVLLFIGIGLFLAGPRMIKLDALRQRQEIERGEINANGVFWNPTTGQQLEGKFGIEIHSGTQTPKSLW
jgi:hypothetical protein